jgi:hypothetical protein
MDIRVQWSEREIATLKSLRDDQGLSFEEIAPRLGRRTPMACRTKYCNLARHAKACWTTPRAHQPWSKEESRELRKLRGRGFSYEDIGQKLGRTINSCEIHYRQMRDSGEIEGDEDEAEWDDEDPIDFYARLVGLPWHERKIVMEQFREKLGSDDQINKCDIILRVIELETAHNVE